MFRAENKKPPISCKEYRRQPYTAGLCRASAPMRIPLHAPSAAAKPSKSFLPGSFPKEPRVSFCPPGGSQGEMGRRGEEKLRRLRWFFPLSGEAEGDERLFWKRAWQKTFGRLRRRRQLVQRNPHGRGRTPKFACTGVVLLYESFCAAFFKKRHVLPRLPALSGGREPSQTPKFLFPRRPHLSLAFSERRQKGTRGKPPFARVPRKAASIIAYSYCVRKA